MTSSLIFIQSKRCIEIDTRGWKGHISCSWVQYATFVNGSAEKPPWFSNWPEKHRFDRGCWDVASSSIEICLAVSEEMLKMPEPIKDRAVILVFRDRPEKYETGRRRWHVVYLQILLNSVKRFQRRRWKCLSQSEHRPVNFGFRSARKTRT